MKASPIRSGGWTPTYDVVVIGGGHNGLTAAAYLARGGAKVVVLERRPFVGGACITEELWPGFRINTYAYLAGMLSGKVIEELDLAQFGYRTIPHDPEGFLPFPDGRSITLWADTARTQKEIARYSTRDADAYPRYLEYWADILRLLEPLLGGPPPSLQELAEQFRGPENEGLLRDLVLRSADDLLSEWFESEELKAALGFSACVGAFTSPRRPGTAYVLAHNSVTELGGRAGAWGFAVGGMGRTTDALARAAQRFGAEIRTGMGVRSLLIQGGRVTGVETEDGRRVEARAVASAVDVKRTLLELAPAGSVSDEVIRQLRSFKTHATTLKFNAALRRLPRFRAAPEVPGPHHQASIMIGPSLDHLDRAYRMAGTGRLSNPPFAEILFQSAADPTVAPPGHHTITCSVKYAPRELVGTSWSDYRDTAAELVLTTLEEYAPDVRELVEHWQVVTPEDLETTLGMTGGSCFHGDLTPDQMFSLRPFPGASGYRLPVAGLYLCGSSAHPGGGVTGVPGRNAAQVILADLREGVGRAAP
ncbi:MAG: NAD(P)/FAD-dependent oxidoreductase [Thermoplasmata archaeon]|nr:NAD(P)/FAD-dependent oxidoreductase [Thermoplasmata archaeon]